MGVTVHPEDGQLDIQSQIARCGIAL